jgi:hypothetical protein
VFVVVICSLLFNIQLLSVRQVVHGAKDIGASDSFHDGREAALGSGAQSETLRCTPHPRSLQRSPQITRVDCFVHKLLELPVVLRLNATQTQENQRDDDLSHAAIATLDSPKATMGQQIAGAEFCIALNNTLKGAMRPHLSFTESR